MIGVFDSGIGGLTILSQIRYQCADTPLIYVADQAFAPYGNLSSNKIKQRSVEITQWLIDQGCTLVVVACNTATAVAIDHLREQFAVAIVGVEPGIKPAALHSKTFSIGILATENTVASERYRRLMETYLPNVNVISCGCTGLADAIEQGNAEQQTLLLTQYVLPMMTQGVDHLVLGCTHYPLAKEDLQRIVGNHIQIIDTSEAVALEVQRRYKKTISLPSAPNKIALFTTKDSASLTQLIDRYPTLHWLADSPASIDLIDI